MVNTEYLRGGAARIARLLHEALNSTPGFRSYFAYGRGPKVLGGEAIRFACQPEVFLHALLTRCTGLQGYGSWVSTCRFLRLVQGQKPDIVHLHNLHGYYLNLNITETLAKLKIPIIWTLHDGWPLTGRCAYWFDCERWKYECGHCPNLQLYPRTYVDTSAYMWKKKMESFASSWSPVIVCPSQWLADQVKDSFLYRFHVEIIPNAVDIKRFQPKDKIVARQRLMIPEDKKVILFVASDLQDERKGAKYFFEALQYIKATSWMVLTLGKRVELPRRTKELAEILQLGYLSNDDEMAQLYSLADVYCITSLDDNFPTTVLESLACGTPVVGFRVGGIPEQVTEDCGILVSPRDIKGLGMALSTLLQDNELREKMSQNCRARAVNYYSVDKFRYRYIQLYQNLLRGGRR